MAQTWLVRAGQGGVHVRDFQNSGAVAIGWSEMGPLPAGVTRQQLEQRYDETFKGQSGPVRGSGLGQVVRFYFEFQTGDVVITYDPDGRFYLYGTITSGVQERQHELGRARRVTWSGKVFRDELTPAARNTLGAIMTLFLVNTEVAAELAAKKVALDATEPAVAEPQSNQETESDTSIGEEFFQKADQFIEDRIARLDWSDMQQLVAGILRAMGYKTRVSEAGPDRGVDITASPDGLGLQAPRIFVEVKHRLGTTIGAHEVRSFLGGRREGDRCLYVSTGGFTQEARYEAERAHVPITLVRLSDIRRLLVENYEQLDAATTALVPLRRLYWPVE